MLALGCLSVKQLTDVLWCENRVLCYVMTY